MMKYDDFKTQLIDRIHDEAFNVFTAAKNEGAADSFDSFLQNMFIYFTSTPFKDSFKTIKAKGYTGTAFDSFCDWIVYMSNDINERKFK